MRSDLRLAGGYLNRDVSGSHGFGVNFAPISAPQARATPTVNLPSTGVDHGVGGGTLASGHRDTLVFIFIIVAIALIPTITESVVRICNEFLFLALVIVAATLASSLLSIL